MDALGEQQRLQLEEEERPLKEAAEQNKSLLLEREQLARKLIDRGEPDPLFVIPDDALNLRMAVPEAQAFSKAQAEQFVSETPSYFACADNFSVLTDYLLSQNIQILTTSALRAAYARLTELGMLKERPEPQSEPEQQPPIETEPDPANKYFTETIFTDSSTGATYTEYQLDQLKSDEFASLMKLPRVNRFVPTRRH